MTRAEKAAEAARLRAQGLFINEIAARMGVSRAYAHELVTDPDGAKARARKDRYRGTCEACGAATNGSDGPGKAPTLCGPCTRARQKAEAKWTRETVVAAMHRWIATYGFQMSAADWDPASIRYRGLSNAEEREARYRTGDWPSATTVLAVFGRWSAALDAAGLPPAPRGNPSHRTSRRARRAVAA